MYLPEGVHESRLPLHEHVAEPHSLWAELVPPAEFSEGGAVLFVLGRHAAEEDDAEALPRPRATRRAEGVEDTLAGEPRELQELVGVDHAVYRVLWGIVSQVWARI